MSNTQERFDPDAFINKSWTTKSTAFDFGRFAQSCANLITANWPLVLILSLCVVSLPKLALMAAHLSIQGKRGDKDPAYNLLNNFDDGLDVIALLVLPFILGWALVRRHAGRSLSLGSLASIIFPSLVVSILVGLGTILGFVLFIIPGLLLLVRWSVSGTIVAAEGASALQAMERSAELSRGYFWPIFAAIIVCTVISSFWEYGIDFVKSVLDGIWPDTHIDWVFECLAMPWGSLPSIAVAVGLYFHLVGLKEGGNDASIAEAFD